MGKPWEPTPWPDEGNAGHDEIFLAVGKALSHWELVETAIAGLFAAVIAGASAAPPAGSAARAYISVANATSRIHMVRATLESWLEVWNDCPYGGDALNLLQECTEWTARRSEIAHGIVNRAFNTQTNAWFLFPSIYNVRTYRYTAANIDYYANGFLDLHARLSDVSCRLGEWYLTITGSDVQKA